MQKLSLSQIIIVAEKAFVSLRSQFAMASLSMIAAAIVGPHSPDPVGLETSFEHWKRTDTAWDMVSWKCVKFSHPTRKTHQQSSNGKSSQSPPIVKSTYHPLIYSISNIPAKGFGCWVHIHDERLHRSWPSWWWHHSHLWILASAYVKSRASPHSETPK